MECLISKEASHLYAFNGYPVHTLLLGNAAGAATETPEICPFRSFRTRKSSSQTYNARAADRDRTV